MEIKKVLGELNPYANQKVQDKDKAERAEAAAKNEGEGSDVVKLSSEGRLLGVAMSAAKSSPDQRAEKVRQLKEQVMNGTYKPDIKKAAKNLIRDDLNLII